MKTLKDRFIAILFVSSLLLVSCEKATNDSSQGKPIVTDKGTPYGQVVSIEVGTSGGTLISPDGKLKLIIPEGALSATKSISIQSISNEAPLGAGNAYRLMPAGTTFQKPVQLVFSYDDQQVDEIPAEFLWIVTQANDGSWNAMMKSMVDKISKTVSIETTHFSDWALGRFMELSLVPASQTVKKGKTIQLLVFGFSRDKEISGNDELVPLIPLGEVKEGDELVPLTPIPALEERLMDFKVKSWTMNGLNAPISNSNGTLTPAGYTATYKAPSQKPATNPVAVTVELEAKDKAGKKSSFFVTSNITVVESDLFLTLKVDGVKFEYVEYGFNGVLPDDPNNYFGVNCSEDNGKLSFVATHSQGSNFTEYFVIDMANSSEGTHPLICIWDGGDDDAVFQHNPISPIAYESSFTKRTYNEQGQKCDIDNMCADFTVTIIRNSRESKTITGYFSGILYEDKETYDKQCKTPDKHIVEGEFNLMPANWF